MNSLKSQLKNSQQEKWEKFLLQNFCPFLPFLKSFLIGNRIYVSKTGKSWYVLQDVPTCLEYKFWATFQKFTQKSGLEEIEKL